MNKSIFLTLVALLWTASVEAQNMLSKTEALQILMDNNFDVRLSKEQLKIAETNTQIFN